jgi:hypothetical protein
MEIVDHGMQPGEKETAGISGFRISQVALSLVLRARAISEKKKMTPQIE